MKEVRLANKPGGERTSHLLMVKLMQSMLHSKLCGAEVKINP